MEGTMAMGGGRRLRLGALAALALAVAAAAEEPEDAVPAAPAPYRAVDPADRLGRSVDPGERSGRTVDPGARGAESREPSFEGQALDPKERRGAARELREVARPPGPRPAAPVDETEGPAYLRLPRRPGETPGPGAQLDERYCIAAHDLAHAQREHERALRDYKRMQRDGHPRGPARALIVERRELSARRLERAEEGQSALLAEAGAQGVELDASACGEDP
jgi:hypothetical protein